MSQQNYRPCPCGSGKKVKFCCKELANDLDKVLRAVEGEQRAGALQHLDRLIAEHGNKPALLSIKASVQMQLGQLQAADETVLTFVQCEPDNPTPYAQSALLDAARMRADEAILQLQRALDLSDGVISMQCYEALSIVTRLLVMQRRTFAARGHLLLQTGLAGEQDRRPLEMLLALDADRDISLLVKYDLSFDDDPGDVPWRKEFEDILKACRVGRWLSSAQRLEELSSKNPGVPVLLRNIAMLRSMTGTSDELVTTWREYARHEPDLDTAVQAEALAQLHEEPPESDCYDQLSISYALDNAETAQERLLSDRRVELAPIDPAEFEGTGEPPPQKTFTLLDKPQPRSMEEMGDELPPQGVALLLLYGKRTDRQARLEMHTVKTPEMPNHLGALIEILGDSTGDKLGEKKLGAITHSAHLLRPAWSFPSDATLEQRIDVERNAFAKAVNETWPDIEQSMLGGKSLTEAAKDESLRVRVLAAIRLLELNSGGYVDFNQLRERLGLPVRGPLDPASVDVERLPATEMDRLEAEKLTNAQLMLCYRRAALRGATQPLKRLCWAVVNREKFDDDLTPAVAYSVLAKLAETSEQALELNGKQRQALLDVGESPAQAMLDELPIRLRRGDSAEAEALMQRLQAQHMEEPGIAEKLYQLLMSLGLIQDDGTPTQAPPAEPVGAAQAGAEPDNKLWTPDGPAEGGEEEGPSKLWLPGMD